MGGGGMLEQGNGGGKRKKKPLDAVINVVPAIDLLSCCISFLLFTAVWTQIARLQVQQLGTGAPETEQTEQQKQLMVTLAMGERGFNLTTSAGTAIDIPALGRGEKGEIRFDVKARAPLVLIQGTVAEPKIAAERLIRSDEFARRVGLHRSRRLRRHRTEWSPRSRHGIRRR